MYICIYVYMYICIFVYLYICIYVSVCLFVCLFAFIERSQCCCHYLNHYLVHPLWMGTLIMSQHYLLDFLMVTSGDFGSGVLSLLYPDPLVLSIVKKTVQHDLMLSMGKIYQKHQTSIIVQQETSTDQ